MERTRDVLPFIGVTYYADNIDLPMNEMEAANRPSGLSAAEFVAKWSLSLAYGRELREFMESSQVKEFIADLLQEVTDALALFRQRNRLGKPE